MLTPGADDPTEASEAVGSTSDNSPGITPGAVSFVLVSDPFWACQSPRIPSA
ncbi:hypothetical protein GCM10010221_34340 [Streptomyces parvus]|nr:hypothetical protein GCM10010221_34340 [Streptomyces parvus]